MKTCVIFHEIDLDGWMSAAIVKHWFLTNNENVRINPHSTDNGYSYKDDKDINEISFIGYNYGQPIPDLSDYNRIIMCDISFPKETMKELFLTGKLTWIDHHISSIKDYDSMDVSFPKGLQDTTFAACELTWKFFFTEYPMPEIVRLLGLYDSFRHKGTKEELKVLEFQYGARECISNYEDAYNFLIQTMEEDKDGIGFSDDTSTLAKIHYNGIAIYNFLCTDAKQSYKNGIEIPIIIPNENTQVPPGSIYGGGSIRRAKAILINKERFNPINFNIDYHKDGYDVAICFHLNNKAQWSFSIYNDNGLADCSLIAKLYGGGGHRGAAGMVLNQENFNHFLNANKLKNYEKH